MTLTLHQGLAAGRWQELTLIEQLANVGSEFGRAARAKQLGNRIRYEHALDRCLELFDLTLADPRWLGRRREVARAREVVVDFLAGENDLKSDVERLDRYFLTFANAARPLRREAAADSPRARRVLEAWHDSRPCEVAMTGANERLQSWLARYPPAEISPSEFEEWVAQIFGSVAPVLDGLRVTLHERITAPDGSYDFDATVRFRWAGMDFLVLVEAKRHASAIKRASVQALHSKVQSVSAQKGVIFATAPFQRGALEFAKAHGIALVSVTEGRFTLETKALTQTTVLSRGQARDLFHLPTYVGYCYGPGDRPGSTRSTLISPAYPDDVRELLLGIPAAVSA